MREPIVRFCGIAALCLSALAIAEAQNGRPPRFATISGHVRMRDGRPVGGASVVLDGGSGDRHTAATNDDGVYRFDGLRRGSYVISAAKRGLPTSEYGQRSADDRGLRVVVREGEALAGVDIVLSDGAAIEGRVTDELGEPIESVLVRLLELRWLGGRRQWVPVEGVRERGTDDTGHYRLYGIPPGQYTVVVVADRWNPDYPPTYYPGATNVADAQTISISGGDAMLGMDVALRPTGVARIAGTIVDAAGRPTRASLVLATPAASGLASVVMKTDAQTDGRFEFRGVTPGQYILQASGPRPPTNEGEGEFASEELSVTGKEVPNLRIQTSPGAFVQGRLTFDVRLAPPPEGFVFVWEPADGDSAPREAGALHRWRPDRLGRFQMSNITGDRRLNVLTAVPGWRMRTATLNGTEIIDDVVHFDARRRDVNNLTIVMTNGAGDIWGRVVDSRGERVERYSVVVFAVDDRLWYPGSRHLKIGRPAGDGTFDVGGLAAGEYYVAAVDAIRGNDSGGDWQDPDVLKAFESRATRVRVEDDGAVGNVTLDLIVTR